MSPSEHLTYFFDLLNSQTTVVCSRKTNVKYTHLVSHTIVVLLASAAIPIMVELSSQQLYVCSSKTRPWNSQMTAAG